jgi:hypothetical protein
VIFVRTDKSKTVPMRLTNVTVGKGSLTITVQPMDAAERAALLEQLRSPDSSTSGSLPQN